MRFLIASIFCSLMLICVAFGQRVQPVPQGIRDGDKAIRDGMQVEPPVESRRHSIDPDALRLEARELQSLAATVPGAVDQVTKGMIPKDATENLKKIEKLAKRMRSEIAP